MVISEGLGSDLSCRFYRNRPAINGTPLAHMVDLTSNFWLVNIYGPFAVMSTERPELIIEGSEDGQHWWLYTFKYKPDVLDKPLSWNIPHQPRLDWQMWFAAKQTFDEDAWFLRFVRKLKQGSPQVLSLLADNPFPQTPPSYIRVTLYRYRFSTFAEYSISGQQWHREFI